MKKYFWLLCLGGMLWACNSSDNSPKEIVAKEIVAVEPAVKTAVASVPAIVPYDVSFVSFADQFKKVSLPYTLDTARILNGYEGESAPNLRRVKSIDRNSLKTYLEASAIEDIQPYLEAYLQQPQGKQGRSDGDNAGTYFYAISQPVRTDAFTALVIGCYDFGGEMGGDGSTGYAYLCTFNPKGKFISGVLLAGDMEGEGAMVYRSVITRGTVTPDLGIETTTTEINGEYSENNDKPKETVTSTVQKYRIAIDGKIKEVAGEK